MILQDNPKPYLCRHFWDSQKHFSGKCYSAIPLVLTLPKSLSHINLPRRIEGNRSVPTTRPESYFHQNSFYISHFASSRDNVNFI